MPSSASQFSYEFESVRRNLCSRRHTERERESKRQNLIRYADKYMIPLDYSFINLRASARLDVTTFYVQTFGQFSSPSSLHFSSHSTFHSNVLSANSWPSIVCSMPEKANPHSSTVKVELVFVCDSLSLSVYFYVGVVYLALQRESPHFLIRV